MAKKTVLNIIFCLSFHYLSLSAKYYFTHTAKPFSKLLQNQASQACLDSVYQTNVFNDEIAR